MEKIGTVKSIDLDYAIIEFKRMHACIGCKDCLLSDTGNIEIKAKNLVSARKGDRVEFQVSGVNIFKASLLVYAVPLVLFLVGTILSYFLYSLFFNDNYQSLFATLTGVGLMLLGSFFIFRSFRKGKNCEFKIVRILSP